MKLNSLAEGMFAYGWILYYFSAGSHLHLTGETIEPSSVVFRFMYHTPTALFTMIIP